MARPSSHDLTVLEEWLAESYAPSLRTAYLLLGNRADAEDAVQEAFLRAWRFRESLATVVNVRPWLYRVVVNTCLSALRREIPARDRHQPGVDVAALTGEGDATEAFARRHDVMTALDALTPSLRVVVVLRYYADLSEKEIAVAIRRSPGTVKSRLHEARRRLAEHPALRTSAVPSRRGANEGVM